MFVACSVPTVHVPYSVVETGTHWFWGYLAKMLGFRDDFQDQWTSKSNRADAKWFLDELYAFLARNAEATVVLLGGDVHVGTSAVVVKRDSGRFVHQFVSSPISNKASFIANESAWLFKRKVSLGPTLADYSARFLHSQVEERNYGIVRVKRVPSPGRYRVSCTLHDSEGGAVEWDVG